MKRSISQGCYELEDLLKHRKGTLESNVCGRDRAEFGLMGSDGDRTGDGPEDDAHVVQKKLSTLLTTAGGELEMVKWTSGLRLELQLQLALLATVTVTGDRLEVFLTTARPALNTSPHFHTTLFYTPLQSISMHSYSSLQLALYSIYTATIQ